MVEMRSISKCGIEIEGNDKWKTIIENASFSLRKE
jgi:hypothetical protein